MLAEAPVRDLPKGGDDAARAVQPSQSAESLDLLPVRIRVASDGRFASGEGDEIDALQIQPIADLSQSEMRAVAEEKE